MNTGKHFCHAVTVVMIMSLSSCTGILTGIYDEPPTESRTTSAGQLYIDASDWTKWHYIDLKAVTDSIAENPSFNPSALWQTFDIPVAEVSDSARKAGIYTYWYDVFGEGTGKYEFRSFYPTAAQEEPSEWTLAVHRNNVRTNGGAVWESPFVSLDELPEGSDWLRDINFTEDEWNQIDVWTLQEQMLLGLVGNQGIYINPILSRWLTMQIPPMPPVFSLNSSVFILRISDDSYAALQLADYMNNLGTKCHLTINYRYPL
ncbi:MAG: HmuY family protein [Muribaculaceae bacterium]|nr:HmuY family protein [Muribaculaceae bacterium]